MISLASRREFILSNTIVKAPPLVPELRLHLARHAHDIFQDAHTFATGGLGARPYWAYAWPGGQALARHILDHPALVRGLSILDLGAGSGIGGIAAMVAGAQAVLAADVDPLASCVVQLNADVNGVVVDTTTDDLLGQDTLFDLIIVGDLVYEPELQDRVGAFIARHHQRGVSILYGDRTTARRPPGRFTLLAQHQAPLTPAMDDDVSEDARVWLL